MTPLTQQLEDKKKGCGVEIVKEQSYISEYGKFKTAKVICGKVYDGDLILCPKCQEIIAILEQAITEKKKRDEEVDNAIDFLSSYPIWTKIYHKEDGDTEEIPEELYPILDNFVKMIQKVLKEQLQSQQNINNHSNNLAVDRVTDETGSADTPQEKISEVQFKALFPDIEKSPVVSNLLQKQRQEILEKIDKWRKDKFVSKYGERPNVMCDKYWEELKQQLNQPKTEK